MAHRPAARPDPMRDDATLHRRIEEILSFPGDRVGKARRIAAAIREAGGYRWVGLYDVTPEEISVIAWSGPAPPSVPRFPADQGLCGAAVRSRKAVNAGDVASDPRYLPTLGSTRSEMIVPVTRNPDGAVVGLIDVESEAADAFGPEDEAAAAGCASLLDRLWD